MRERQESEAIRERRGERPPALAVLTAKQRAAVTHPGGPLLVVAGAGTGKTRILTERITWLVRDQGVPPQEILALTFTEKAAGELQERVDVALPLSAFQPWIGTFHGFGEFVLRQHALAIGLARDCLVLSAPELWLLLKRNLYRLPLVRFRPFGNPTKFVSALVAFFTEAKDQGITPERLAAYAASVESADEKASWAELADVYRAYVELQRRAGILDVSDLLLETLRLFRERPAILAAVRAQYPYLLVDEYQDTNAAQVQLVHLLAGEKGNLTVVCDDDQAIFAFRGSHVGNVLTFRDHFPSATLLTLTDNFRSPQVLLDHAHRFIQQNNPHRLEATAGISKRLTARAPPATPTAQSAVIEHLHFDTAEHELAYVAEEILRLVDGGRAYRDLAILVRTNAQTPAVAASLLRRDIPHTVSGAKGLFGRPEIRDVLAYLRLLADPTDGRALFRLLAHPALTVRPVDRARVLVLLRAARGAVLPLLADAALLAAVAPESREGIERLARLLERHLTLVRTITLSTHTLEFLERSGILKHAIAEAPQHPEVLPNLQAFLTTLRGLERGLPESEFGDLLEILDATVEGGEGPAAASLPDDVDAVRILTVHAAKGLEFPVVFLVGVTADRFPARGRSRALELPSALAPAVGLPGVDDRVLHVQEERRLFYVAVTRASARLVLTSSTITAGARLRRKPSPFIGEADIPSTRSPSSLVSFEQPALPLAPAPPPQPRGDHAVALTASKLTDYHTCPKKFEFRHVLRVPTPPHAALSFGTTIHEVLRDLGVKASVGERPTLAEALTLYDRYWISEGYESAEHEAARKTAGRDLLRAYLAQHPELLTQSPVAVEARFSLPLSSTRLTGRIDRIDRLDNGSIVVTDFKTGSAKAKDADADLQLSIYALAARRALHLQPDRLRLSFVEENTDAETTRSEDADQQTVAKIEGTAERIGQGDFRATPGVHCRICDFRAICDFAAF